MWPQQQLLLERGDWHGHGDRGHHGGAGWGEMIILLWWYKDDLPRLQEQGGGHRQPGADPDQPPHQLAQGDILRLHGPLHKQVACEDVAVVTSIERWECQEPWPPVWILDHRHVRVCAGSPLCWKLLWRRGNNTNQFRILLDIKCNLIWGLNF